MSTPDLIPPSNSHPDKDPRSGLEQFFGGAPLWVLFRLVMICVIVGFILSTLGLTPYNILMHLERFVQRVIDMGFGAVEWVFDYFLIGAAIVIPFWLLSRLFKAGK
jgi:hypothetical protein